MELFLLLTLPPILAIVAAGFFVAYSDEAARRDWRSQPHAIDSVVKAAIALFAAAICGLVSYSIMRGFPSIV